MYLIKHPLYYLVVQSSVNQNYASKIYKALKNKIIDLNDASVAQW